MRQIGHSLIAATDRNHDLVVVFGVSSLLLITVVSDQLGFLRAVMGIPFVLVCPGYALLCALFPRGSGFDALSTLVVSVLLSIAVLALLGLFLNQTPWGIQVSTLLAGLVSFVGVASSSALFQRQRSRNFRPGGGVNRLVAGWRSIGSGQKMLLVAGFIVLAVISFSVLVPPEGEPITEFYLLGDGGTLDTVPDTWRARGPNAITLGVANQTNRATRYEVVITAFPVSKQQFDVLDTRAELFWHRRSRLVATTLGSLDFEVGAGLVFERDLALTAPPGAEYLLVTFELTRQSSTDTLRELHIWLDFSEATRIS